MATVTETTVLCYLCNKEQKAKPRKDGGMKTPLRWRKTPAGFRCADCTKANYLPRRIRLQLLGPAEEESRTSADMYKALMCASSDCNRLANWLVQRLYAADPAVSWKYPDKFPAMPRIDFYADACRAFPSLAPGNIVAMAQTVTRYYTADRFESLGCLKRAVRNYQWDSLPIPVRRQSWDVVRQESGALILRLQIGPGTSWRINFRADAINYERIKQALAGDAELTEMKLIRRVREQRPGESAPPPRVWYAAISAFVPKPTKTRSRTERALTLGNDPEYLWFGAIDNEPDSEPFIFPAVELKARIVRHQIRSLKLQIDNSVTRRAVSRRTAQRRAQERTDMCERNNRKVALLIKEQCAALVGKCAAKNITCIQYDTTDRGFAPHLPWHRLRQDLKAACENAGIVLLVHEGDKEP